LAEMAIEPVKVPTLGDVSISTCTVPDDGLRRLVPETVMVKLYSSV